MKKECVLLFCLLFVFIRGNVCAAIPRSEYPRPQFERSAWVNLNGAWTYAFDFGNSGKDRNWQSSKHFDGTIIVPFCPESRLSGVEHKDFINAMWYQREISVPSDWKGKEILLNFGAVYYQADIYIDGKFVLSHSGGSSSFSVNISRYVVPGKQHNLVVYVKNDLRSGKQPGGKQCVNYFSQGCSYTRVTGIWQTVWMEAVSPEGLKSVYACPDIDQHQLVVRPRFYHESDGLLTATVLDGKKVVARRSVRCGNNDILVLPIKKMKLWSPESPFLYRVIYKVTDQKGNVIDEVRSYAGMRKVSTENGYVELNNKPYYQRLVLDQGYYPDGEWTAPTDEALKKDIELGKAAGFNGARTHQKAFEDRYFYWADKLGYFTYAEFPSWDLDVNDELAARNFIGEWSEVVENRRNHPSIAIWTPFNETWGCQPGTYLRLVTDVYHITKAMDPTRPINDASGDGHVATDIWSVHNYERDPDKLIKELTFTEGQEPYRNQPEKKFLASYEGQPYIVDEFGGLPWMKTQDHKNSWGYGGDFKNMEDFYECLQREVDALKTCKNVCGFCYTQLTDVEQEKNGICYYDRTPKFDMKRIKTIFESISNTETRHK
ncbi:MAG: beta-glucuronidase [Prevotella sp.]|jgi:beta-galactosidase/beta-glucuronidase|nr:beta-glucuronidase [Prevotella sp.]